MSGVGGSDGGTCVDSDGGIVCSVARVPGPGNKEERRTGTGTDNACVDSGGDDRCPGFSCVDPGSGGGSPRGGRGPGSPLASRPVRGQRIGRVEGWGVLENRCEDVGRCGNGHDGPDGGLGDVVVLGVKGWDLVFLL